MNARCLFLLLSLSCAIQKQVISEADRVRPEVLTQHLFAPSVGADLDVPDEESNALGKKSIIRATAMEGPFSSVEDYCEWLFRTSERFNPVAEDNHCEYSPSKNESAQVVFATSSELEGGEYHLALETSEGWFVADSQYLDDLSNIGAGNTFDATLSRQKLSVEDVISGGAPEVIFSAHRKVVHTCNGCEVPSKRVVAYQEQMIVCSTTEEPSCIALSAQQGEGSKLSPLSVSFSGTALSIKDALLFTSQRETPLYGEYQIVF
jgi:hypothetical protein